MEIVEVYRKLILIRYTEQKLESLFKERKLKGTMHGCIGQEINAVAILSHIDIEKDWVTGNHRSHGHLLALTGDPYPLIAELMGKKSGFVMGKGGSQHISYKNFINNGITGGMVGVGVGIAFTLKQKTKDAIVVSFFGDGAMNEGYVSESLNLASYLKVPILFVLENNKYAMSTRTEKVTGGNFRERVEAFGLEYHFIVGDDFWNLYQLAGQLISKIRRDRYPIFLEILTHRFSGHSKSDKREYIPPEEDKEWRERDGVEKIRRRLIEEIGKEAVEKIEREVEFYIEECIRKAEQDEYPEASEIYEV